MNLTAQIGGLVPARKALDESHHVMRFASRSRRFLDPETDQYLGPTPAAFALRDDDNGGMSVTWVEAFGSFSAKSRGLAAAAHRETLREKKLPKEAIFAWAKVADIKAAGNQYSKALRVVHDPVDGNPGHSEIRHFTDDDLELLDYFSSFVFSEYSAVKDMDIP